MSEDLDYHLIRISWETKVNELKQEADELREQNAALRQRIRQLEEPLIGEIEKAHEQQASRP